MTIDQLILPVDTNECLTNNGGCEQLCSNTPGSFICLCASGFRITADGLSCVDQDECLTGNDTCQQRCVNTNGSYTCTCEDGYTLNENNITCDGELWLYDKYCKKASGLRLK